jgi:hypothetical protein
VRSDLHMTFNLPTNTNACSAAKFRQFYETNWVQQPRFLKKCFGCLVALGGGRATIVRPHSPPRLPTTTAAIYWKWAFISTACCRFRWHLFQRSADEQTAYAHAAATELQFDFGANPVPASLTGGRA